jgi:hypothetical protein
MKGCMLSSIRFAYGVRAAQKQELPLHLRAILEHPHSVLSRDRDDRVHVRRLGFAPPFYFVAAGHSGMNGIAPSDAQK